MSDSSEWTTNADSVTENDTVDVNESKDFRAQR